MDIRMNIEQIKNNIKVHAQKANRDPSDILIMAVTKTVDVERIQEAIDNGITDIGENYVQEILEKYADLKNTNLHFIGHLQSNKVKEVLKYAHAIQTVDSLSLVVGVLFSDDSEKAE